MKSKIEFEECLKDSPKFRLILDEQEHDIEHLEQKLEKVIKMCTAAVDSGKEYIKNQSAFATHLWDLQQHFQDDKSAHNALGKMIHCLQEMNKFHTILLDQASRTVLKNLSSFVKCEIKDVKDCKQLFLKVSENLDSAFNKNAQANKNRTQEVVEAVNYLSATQSCFKHTALDYVNVLMVLQAKKKPEILSTLLSYIQACSTYYHQGTDLCEDFDPFFKILSDDVNAMRTEAIQFEKNMENRHTCVNENLNEATKHKAKSVARMEGYLFKRTSKGFKSWNRRWFYMYENQLVYRKRSGEDLPTVMEEDLSICTVRPVNDSDRRFCFEVISPSKSHILQADSEDIFQTWIAALQRGIGAAITWNNDNNTSSEANDNSLIVKNRNYTKKFWERFLKIPGNSSCCDCGSADPRWASINLGITLCIACSGVHRSLGVHYSKVRSLTLDAWEPEIMKVMMELGNNIINKIYEANIDGSLERATENCDTPTREAWIKAKYVEKRFLLGLRELETIDNDNEDDKPKLNVPDNVKKWTVKKLRRRPTKRKNSTELNQNTDSTENFEEKDTTEAPEHEDLKQNIIVIGEELKEPDLSEDFCLGSDQESTDGEEELRDDDEIGTMNINTILFKASLNHNLPVMCQALALGADKNWSSSVENGRTPLHQSILSGSSVSCEFLLLNGTKIDSVDDGGYTALHLATERGYTALAYLLLKHKAKHDILTVDGKQALDIAVEQANADIVTLLRLTRLNEEIGVSEQGPGGDETYNNVMKDFSQFACSQPHRLQRAKNDNDD